MEAEEEEAADVEEEVDTTGTEVVTDVTGRTDRGTRQTCKRGQEQD